ncbi:hypothetical protein [Maridesulfovibrio hydrothermalis]|uniref:Putative lipoprotein n=1 Tax=Maridesulfovibrio hydrothermalis AM13 = DSM 14728 TaxID=1121451 RepID=L0R8D1_9BACT|nr:hypothetical protein [Maridesulfovibrio hydrothermalis]CCO23018.1 putative lipoprotein [Maridesulfovibrio hydrothermalis AM13 = DSM 14728]
MKIFIRMFLISMLFVSLVGCITTRNSSSEEPAVAVNGVTESFEEFVPYTEFDDIAVPNELSQVPENSYVADGRNFKYGKIVLKGRVENKSLIDFFKNQMVKDNWTLSNSFTSTISALTFEKPYKSCTIRIFDGSYNTEVEIYAVELKSAAFPESGGVQEQNIQ